MKSPASPRPDPAHDLVGPARAVAPKRQQAENIPSRLSLPPFSFDSSLQSPCLHPWRPCPSRAPAVPVCVRERDVLYYCFSRGLTTKASTFGDLSTPLEDGRPVSGRGRVATAWHGMAWQAEAGAGTERLPHHSYYCPALALPLLARFWQLNLCSVRLDIGYIHAANSNSNGNGRQLTGPWGCVSVCQLTVLTSHACVNA